MNAKLGSGARFRALSRKVGSDALAAWIGRKKYGKERFQRLAASGRKTPPPPSRPPKAR